LDASDFRLDIAENVRLSELTEIDGTDPLLELELELELLLALEDDELLQAAAARHTASDTDATAAPFLATRIIKITSRFTERPAVPPRHMRY
jgi:hypothetical protein